MTSQRLAIAELGRVFEGESISGLSEWQLLERYLERHDETAFEAIVTRHGPMVLGVCRRALGWSPEAEDAFQATFLVLIRRARDLGPHDAIGPWLHGVARRVAGRARSRATRRRRHEAISPEFPLVDRGEVGVDAETVEILDLELGRLPGKYRSPLVLCYLEGRTHEEAARDLHWPVGTVKGRLARARALLRSRLARRGLAPMSGAWLVVPPSGIEGLLSRPLVNRTVGASARLATGQSVAHVVSQSVTSLVEGVLAAMFVNKIKWGFLIAVATGVAFTSAAVLGQHTSAPKETPPTKTGGLGPRGDMIKSKSAVARSIESPGAPVAGAVAPVRRHPVASVGADAGQDDDPRSQIILAKLEEPIAMSFANETPLDDVLKYIKQATTTSTFNGIPIYVDPVGLQEAERSVSSTIQIDLEGIPLRRTLQLLLAQIGLVYFVEDGILVVTSEDRARNPLPPAVAAPAPIDRMIEKSERGELSSTELKELIEVIKLRRQVKMMHDNFDAPAPGPASQGAGERDSRQFPGEEKVAEASRLLKEVRELIRVLKVESTAKKPAEEKKSEVKKVQ